MLKAWTRRGQIEMIGEIKRLVAQAEMLASQERAERREGGPASRIRLVLERSRTTLAALETDLASGTPARDTRRELSAFYRILVRETARADALRHGTCR